MSDPFVRLEPTAPAVPLLVSIPHTGMEVPEGIAARFAGAEVAALPDTDFHLHRLYAFARGLGATILHARYSRYVIDLNRAPDSRPLYPGRFETTLVPLRTFDDTPIYRAGQEPDETEVAERRERYWLPYHQQLQEILEDLRGRFGYALLFEAHSIRSEVPALVPGRLPDLMLGTAEGAAAAPALIQAVEAVHQASGREAVTDASFKGGYITRRHGRPAERVHALQLEMSQRNYMVEGPPFAWDEGRAAALTPVLRDTLTAFIEAGARHLGGRSAG